MRNCFTRRFTGPIVLAIVTWFAAGCGYPQVSPRAYEISQALYAVCNQKNGERLVVVQSLIQESLAEKALTEREATWLNEILADAENGDWDAAAREARRMMADQVGR